MARVCAAKLPATGAEKRKNAVNRRERDAPARGEDGIGRAERKRLGNGTQVRLNDVKVIKDFKDLKDFNPKTRNPETGGERPSDDESENK